jgi:hypothetical protein
MKYAKLWVLDTDISLCHVMIPGEEEIPTVGGLFYIPSLYPSSWNSDECPRM